MQKVQLSKKQTTDCLLMVRPSNFGYNPQTAESNAFQTNDGAKSASEIKAAAVAEFDAFVEKLRSNGISVFVVQDSATPVKPDAVFPNNWVSMHRNGTMILYPLLTENRRLERQQYVLDSIAAAFEISRTVDFSPHEQEGRILEGTGSLILDHLHGKAYACVSARTNTELLQAFCEETGYEAVTFRAVGGNGQEIYHTNVMMAMGDKFVVIGLETIPAAAEREALLQHFAATEKEVIALSLAQIEAFAGNMLQVENADGKTFLVMSEQAYLSLNAAQIAQIEAHTTILSVPIYTIEKYGGGSARCMMAEIFLPKK